MSDELLQQAQRLHRSGDISEAWRVYVEVLRNVPQNFEARQALGVISFQGGRFNQAQELLGEALRLNPRSLECLCLRGVALLHLQCNQEALACFNAALSISPHSIEALSNRALAYLELNRFEEALGEFETIFRIDPAHAMSWSNRGNVLVAMRRFEEAVASYDRALALRPDFPEARDNRKYALGMNYFEKGQFDQAQYVLDEAVRLNPRLLDGLCMRGIALLRLRRHPEALACFERALAMRPDFVEALSNRATAFLEMNRLEDALAGFDAALAVDPRHAVSWNNQGNALTALGRHEDAISSYDKALAIQPAFPEANENRLNAMFALRRLSRCPPGYIRTLFDDYSSYYDAAMVEALGYRGHLHLRTLADRLLPRASTRLRILDLGCGTGLVGEVFRDLARGGRLDGIDLSPRMIEAARSRAIYDDLILGDLEALLAEADRDYDLILAADTMVYFGDLSPTLTGIFERLVPGGFYLFAVEAMAGDGWEQMPVNRFRHSESYLRAASTRAGLDVAAVMECSIRREMDEPVLGLAVALQKPAH